jgi:membrane protein DedA with SNARE-associated domain/pimeloyl-ACP methyl ester carboxylesterase
VSSEHAQLLAHLIQNYGYPIVALLVAAEGVGVPLPGETALILAAAAAARGQLSIAGVIIAASIGTIAGGSGGYWLGRTGGLAIVHRLGRYVGIDSAKIERGQQFFARYGARTVFLARFVAILRILAGLLAGAARMPFAEFSLYNALGGIAWSALFAGLGYVFGRNMRHLELVLGRYGFIVAGIAVVAIIVVARRSSRKGKSASALPQGQHQHRHPVARTVGLVVLVLAGVYVLILAAMAIGQTQLVFPASLRPATVKSDTALGAERVDYRSADSVPQVAFRLRARTPSPWWILYFHGNGTVIPLSGDRYALFRRLGVNVFAPEYRGYAGVPGTPSEAAVEHDARAAYAYLVDSEHVAPDHIVLYGWSLGSAVAIDLATTVPAHALIAEAAPASVLGVAKERFPLVPVGWLMTRNHFASDAKIQRVHMPVLFIHARDDVDVPEHNGRELYALANQPKSFLELPKGGHKHAPSENADLYLDGVAGFLNVPRAR